MAWNASGPAGSPSITAPCLSASSSAAIWLVGIAKANSLIITIAPLIPTSSPWRFTSGPPLSPAKIGTSVMIAWL